MNLQCRVELARAYKAGSQIARVLSEDWCVRELYCAACDSDRLLSSRANTPAIDFCLSPVRSMLPVEGLQDMEPEEDSGRSLRVDVARNTVGQGPQPSRAAVLRHLGD